MAQAVQCALRLIYRNTGRAWSAKDAGWRRRAGIYHTGTSVSAYLAALQIVPHYDKVNIVAFTIFNVSFSVSPRRFWTSQHQCRLSAAPRRFTAASNAAQNVSGQRTRRRTTLASRMRWFGY